VCTSEITRCTQLNSPMAPKDFVSVRANLSLGKKVTDLAGVHCADNVN